MPTNCAPALSADGQTLYVAVNVARVQGQAQRGYLLTGSNRYLKPFNAAVQTAQTALVELARQRGLGLHPIDPYYERPGARSGSIVAKPPESMAIPSIRSRTPSAAIPASPA